MKQLLIIEILNGEDKHRSKAMTIVVGVPGVESVALQGENRNHLAIVGNGVDSVSLINILRKKMKRIELVSVTPVDGDFIEDAIVTVPEFQHPTNYHHPPYQAVVAYDHHGYRPDYNDNYGHTPNYYDNYGHTPNYYDHYGHTPNYYDHYGHKPNYYDNYGYRPNYYDNYGYRPNYYDNNGYMPNDYDNNGYRPNDSEGCNIM